MARGGQIHRHLNLLRTLQTRGVGIPLAQLAQDFEVSDRTIQRDLELLQELGFPVAYEEDAYGKRFWKMPNDFFRAGSLALSLTEALSLHLAERLCAALAGTHFAEGLDSILAKIRSLIPSQAAAYFTEASGTLHVRPFASTDYSGHRDVIRMLDEGIRDDRSVEITYRSLWRGDEYTTLYDPYGLVLHLDDLFLVGRSRRANALRVFKVTRILSARSTREVFERPEDFDLGSLFQTSFGIIQSDATPIEIVVQFNGVAAAVVEERIWHDSQRLEWLPNEPGLFAPGDHGPDALIATFRLAEVLEFKRWMKGFGDQAVVLKPDWLRDQVHEELAAAARRYET